MESEGDEENISSMFTEPAGYRKSEEPFHFEEFALLSGEKLMLRLVGSSPLWVADPDIHRPMTRTLIK